jgi:protein-tyrosine phosphatase
MSEYSLLCAPNFRDIGGLRAGGGRRVARGLVFRSEAVLAPSAEDAQYLDGHGVRLVADLRGVREREAAPNHWWRGRGVALLEMDISADIRGTAHWQAMRDDPGEAGAVALMRLTYRALPRATASHMEILFGRIAQGDLPVAVHCTAGKDRTGVVIALLLTALGVPRDEIYADYLKSGACLNPRVVEATRGIMEHGLGGQVDEAALHAVCGVRAEYLDASFAAIEEDYGSAARYLSEAAGLTEALSAALHRRLLA